MIKLKIGNAGHETDIRFPISESDLYDRLFEILVIDSPDQQPPVTVTGIYWPEEFSVLEGRQVNLDEMNYLAKRMESFDALEMDQFLIGISKLDDPSPKDLINLTFNLDHFTLARDVSNYGKIGRAYVMNTEGAVPANDEDDPKYVAIGKDLIDRGLAQITAKGLLGSVDFEKIIPMPPSLHIECGSKTDRGLNAYRDFLKSEAESEKEYLDQKPTITPEEWELGKQAYENIREYGAPTWYEWSVAHWGTKWNAYGMDENAGEGQSNEKLLIPPSTTRYSAPRSTNPTRKKSTAALIPKGILCTVVTRCPSLTWW